MLQSRFFGQPSRVSLLAIIATLSVQSLLAGGTVYWDGGTDFNWFTPANWSTNAVPSSSSDVVLNQAPSSAPYTVNINTGGATINSITTDSTSNLNIGASLTLSATSQINSTLSLSNLSSLSDTGSLTLAGTTNMGASSISSTNLYISSGTPLNTAQLNITINGNTYFPSISGSIENDGSVTLSTASNLSYQDFSGNRVPELTTTGAFNNKGTFTASSTIFLYYVGGTAFNNSGTFINESPFTAFSSLASNNGTQFDNSGTVDSKSGGPIFNSGGTDSGSFIAEANAFIAFGGNTTLTSTSTITGAGFLDFGVTGTATDAGTVNVGSASFDAGTATFTNTFVTTGTTTVDGGTVYFNKPATAGNLVLSSGDLGGSSPSNSTLNVTGNMTWTGGQTYGGDLKITVSSNTSPNTATITIGSMTATTTETLNGGTLTNVGTATVVGGGSMVFENGYFNNHGSLTINSNANYTFASISSETGQFNNAGSLIEKGSGITAINSGGSTSMYFTNSGSVDVQGGTLQINVGQQANDTGSYSAESGGALVFGVSRTLESSSTITGNGTVTISSGAGLTDYGSFNGGTLNISGSGSFSGTSSAANVNLTGGTLGASKFTITGNLNWNGTLSGTNILSSGTTPNTAIANITYATLYGTFENDGSVSFTGLTFNNGGSIFNNKGTFTANTASSSNYNNAMPSSTNTFNNTGVFIKQGIAELSFSNSASGTKTSFNNTGTLEIQAGILAFDSNTTFSNTGTVDVHAGTLQPFGPVTQYSSSTSTLSAGTWNVRNNGTLQLQGSISTIGSAASVTMDGANASFSSIGSLITNQGHFTLTDGYNIQHFGFFSNSGTFTVGPLSSFESGNIFTNTGTINLAGGILKLDHGLATGTTVRSQLLAGYNHGSWNGTDIISTLAAADPAHATGVGYTVNGTSYTLEDTWYGDTDLSGTINNSDLLAMVPGVTNATWQEGDFNYDGVVNADDYTLFMLGDAEQTGTFPTVPEPGMMAIGGGLICVLRKRHR